MMELEVGDYTSEAECTWIMGTLRTLAGGQAWETEVPDGVTLKPDGDGVMPYIIVRFAEPAETSAGRNIGSGEKGQPYLLSMTIMVYGDDADAVRATMSEIRRLLLGERPSLTASVLKARGGHSWALADTGSRPTRYQRAAFYRCNINI